MVIQVRKYQTIKELVKKPIMDGEMYMALKIDLQGHFEPMKKRLLQLSLV